jgi:hypothetical protein
MPSLASGGSRFFLAIHPLCGHCSPTPGSRFFDMPSPPQISKILRKDLAHAGVPYKNEKGRYFDFHSFRKCKATHLRIANVDAAVSMGQMGHTDIRQTFEMYTDEDMLPKDNAMAATPELTFRPEAVVDQQQPAPALLPKPLVIPTPAPADEDQEWGHAW